MNVLFIVHEAGSAEEEVREVGDYGMRLLNNLPQKHSVYCEDEEYEHVTYLLETSKKLELPCLVDRVVVLYEY